MYFVYILISEKTNRYYIGHTQNTPARLKEHNSGLSKSTKSDIPWNLAYQESFKTRSEAMKREREIKNRKSRKFIESLISR
ncbi:GIY-YIG nuclease family protein [bacterium]|nr:GIY-YIG nuclease family protein [bacterium]